MEGCALNKEMLDYSMGKAFWHSGRASLVDSECLKR